MRARQIKIRGNIAFEHTTCTWWDTIIFYDPYTTPPAQNLRGSRPQPPRIDAYESFGNSRKLWGPGPNNWELNACNFYRCKKTFLRFLLFFIKTRFQRFYFLVAKFLSYQTRLNSCIKQHLDLSGRFNMAAIGNSRMKSHSSQTLSCTL